MLRLDNGTPVMSTGDTQLRTAQTGEVVHSNALVSVRLSQVADGFGGLTWTTTGQVDSLFRHETVGIKTSNLTPRSTMT